MKLITFFLLIALFSCKKSNDCLNPGNVTIVSKNIIKWSNPVAVTIEIKGLDGPYHGLMTPNEVGEHRVEGHAMVRIKTECSAWSEWMEVNY